eukprot:TRINITY_DN18091_c0_g1_i2.p1 TRINITY_DN18091_c0_g1~~TRINITY_DN18091_c0_g1_i2.p1  ORF type:complete len:289 (+),score=64.18 TRINITY_DN18091_c0_g1_i2:166-1032(+)
MCIRDRLSPVLLGTRIEQPSSFQITLEQLQQHFHLPLAHVARKFGVGTTFMKKKCRLHGIKRWPFRKIRSQTLHKQERLHPGGDERRVASKPAVIETGCVALQPLGLSCSPASSQRPFYLLQEASKRQQVDGDMAMAEDEVATEIGEAMDPEDAALVALTALSQAAASDQRSTPTQAVPSQSRQPPPSSSQGRQFMPYTLAKPAVLGGREAAGSRPGSTDIQQFAAQRFARKQALPSGAMRAKHGIGCWRLRGGEQGDEVDASSWVLLDGADQCATQLEYFVTPHCAP